jgi:hypothetical protein
VIGGLGAIDRFIKDLADDIDAENAYMARIDAAAARIDAAYDRAHLAAYGFPNSRAETRPTTEAARG